MAITVSGYPLGWLQVLGDAAASPLDLEGSSSLKLSLHTSTYTPNLNTDDFFNDATNQLTAANGYSRQTLTNVTLSHDATTDQIRLDFDDVAWTFTADQTWRYGVVAYDTGGADTTDPLLLLLDWGSNQTVNGSYTIVIDPTGILAFDFGTF